MPAKPYCITYVGGDTPPLASVAYAKLLNEYNKTKPELEIDIDGIAAPKIAAQPSGGLVGGDVRFRHTGDIGKDVTGTDYTIALLLDDLFGAATSQDTSLCRKAEQLKWCQAFRPFIHNDYTNTSDDPQVSITHIAKILNSHLTLRTFVVGHQLTVADVMGFVAIKRRCPQQLCDQLYHLLRWIAYLTIALGATNMSCLEMSSPVQINVDVREVATAHKKQSNQTEYTLPKVNEGDKVVMRFPPEPSGYLHIGHAKAALLNNYFARKYNGTLIVRFDDTNPSKEKEEFESSILEDLKMLNITPDVISHSSDYFDELYKYAEKFITQGQAYADKTSVVDMRLQRGEGIESSFRNASVDENRRLFKEMKNGSEEGRSCCLRAKIDMKSKNKCMRDPVLYRCIVEVPHHKTGHAHKAYPTYDFCCPIVDSIEGVTHAMRTNEYADRIPQYNWIQETADLKRVIVYEFSRLNFVNTVLSKRKLQWIIDTGIVTGWDDPRLPTIRGITRRGLTLDGLLQFILSQGPSKNANLMEWGALWNRNKQIIDPEVPRYMAVAKENAVKIILTGAPDTPQAIQRDLHPKNTSKGKVVQYLYNTLVIEQEDAIGRQEGEEVTMIKWGNAVFDKIVRSDDEKIVLTIYGHLHLDGDFKTTKAKLHWLPLCNTSSEYLLTDSNNHNVSDNNDPSDQILTPVIFREFDTLITKRKPEEDDELADIVNVDSMHDTLGLADPLVRCMPQGTIIQLERRGYFIVDKPFESAEQPCILIKIPDGKCKAMSVITTKVDGDKISRGS